LRKINLNKFYKKLKSAYVHIAKTGKACDLMLDPSSLQGERPTTNKKSNCLNHSQNLVVSPVGAQRQDGLTDPLMQSN